MLVHVSACFTSGVHLLCTVWVVALAMLTLNNRPLIHSTVVHLQSDVHYQSDEGRMDFLNSHRSYNDMLRPSVTKLHYVRMYNKQGEMIVTKVANLTNMPEGPFRLFQSLSLSVIVIGS